MAVIKKDGGFMPLPINIKRGNPIPLDSTSIWYDYAALETYAQSGATAYVGQIVTWVNETDNTSKVYVIADTAGTLTEVGSGAGGDAINVDNNTIVLDDKGLLTLKDFGTKYYRYVEGYVDEETGAEVPATYVAQIVDAEHPWKSGLIPQVVADPENANRFIIGWYEPNPTTLEGINTAIAGLQAEVVSVQSNLANNYYTKEQAQAEFAGALHYRGSVETYDDLSLKSAEAGDVYIVKDTHTEYIYDGENWEELGDQVDLSNFETRVGTLESTVNLHTTKIGTLESDVSNLKSVTSTFTTSIGTLEQKVGSLESSVGNLTSVIGAPEIKGEDGAVATPATGLYAEMQEIANREVGNLNAIKGLSINGTDAPISESKVLLYDFTRSNGLAGLVVPPSDDIKESEDTYVLNAKGNWVVPFDKRIGTLTYNETTYTTVTEYIDARTAEMSMTWQTITD